MNTKRDVERNEKIAIPREIQEYLWTRYMPESTYNMYVLIGYLGSKKVAANEITKILVNANFGEEKSIPQVIDEKKRVLAKLGLKYPQTRKEDLELLLKFNLIKVGKDKHENMVYAYNIPVPRPENVLKLDDDEKETLQNIRFEIKHEKAINMVLTLLLNNSGNLMCSVDHLLKVLKVKITEMREVLNYLINIEDSVRIKSDKNVLKLKKDDKLYLEINKEVFEQKRFVV